jgi:hypothetical protein
MKIQDMRSGIVHLNKRMEREPQQNHFGDEHAARGVAEPEPEAGAEKPCELDAPCWSVVSFDKREAGALTYRQAAELMAFLETRGRNGLCIITDDAALRYQG